MTSDPLHNLPNSNFHNDIAGSFRTISLVKPDLGQILKAKCSALGFRAANILALRLKVMSELVKDQLWVVFSFWGHFEFSGVVECEEEKNLSYAQNQ